MVAKGESVITGNFYLYYNVVIQVFLCLGESINNTNKKIVGKRGNVVRNDDPSEPQLLDVMPCDFSLGLVTCFGQ